jgi:hypothetical protein
MAKKPNPNAAVLQATYDFAPGVPVKLSAGFRHVGTGTYTPEGALAAQGVHRYYHDDTRSWALLGVRDPATDPQATKYGWRLWYFAPGDCPCVTG